MSEMGGSYDPGPWRGWNYNSARKAHTKLNSNAGRGYGGSTSSAKKSVPNNLVPDSLTTNAKSPLVVVVDGTGSMGKFPETIFKKLPLLDDSAKDYLDDCEISYSMIGDAGSDRYPLQVQPFGKGKKMVESLNKLIIEGNGGGNQQESYDLAALYYARNVKMPKANKPILIFVCDEGVYPNVNKSWAKSYAKVELAEKLSRKQLFEELQTKFSVYVIRKHYQNGMSNDKMTGTNLKIHKQWEGLVGSDRMAILNDPQRVVDVILGLLAHETEKVDFFKKELEWRQTPAQVKTVYKSMVSVGKKTSAEPTGKSIIKRPKTTSKSKGSQSLI
jgi:hypothetical protein